MPQDYALKLCGCKPSDLERYFSQAPALSRGCASASYAGIAYGLKIPCAAFLPAALRCTEMAMHPLLDAK